MSSIYIVEMKKYLTSLFVIMLVLSAAAERQQYERYQSIVDRQMFGPLPPGFDPTKSPNEVQKSSASSAAQKELTKEQEKVKSAIRFSMINLTPEGETVIGFTDNSDPKVPVHYYMKVGEKRNGWEVKEADADTAKMTIVKDGVEVSLELGGDSSGGGKGKGGGAVAANGGRGMLGNAARSRHANTLLSNGNSLRGRRMLRRQQEAEDQAAAAERARQQAEERAAQKAEDEARREEQRAEREEQRKQLMQIQEELRKAREERQQREKEAPADGATNE